MKLWKVAAFLCLTSVGWGQAYYQNNVYTTTYINGTRVVSVVSGAKVQICTTTSGTCTQVPVYSDSGLTTQITQPMPVDGSGNFGFWVGAGTYSFRVMNAQSQQIQAYPFTVGGGGSQTFISAGAGISVTGSGSSGSPYVIAVTTPFAINSFTGCAGSLELGAHVTNPTCSATYSGTPTSASITNTDSIDSPLALSSPFTSGTIVGTLTHSTVATATVMLTAIGSSTQTATQTYTWNPRIFGGFGTAGATSSVTASGTTAVLSTTDVLASVQLGAESVGQTFGPYTPSGQVVYLLLIGGSHSFTDVCTGFPFFFNTPVSVSFVNANGTNVSMSLYASNPLTYSGSGCAFTPRVTS